jgi:hypothetical protein
MIKKIKISRVLGTVLGLFITSAGYALQDLQSYEKEIAQPSQISDDVWVNAIFSFLVPEEKINFFVRAKAFLIKLVLRIMVFRQVTYRLNGART